MKTVKTIETIIYKTAAGKQPFTEWQEKLTKNMAKKKIYKNYEELLHEELQDPKLAIAYLNEALKDEDENVFLIALKDVLNAQGKDITALAKKAHINRQNIYRMLSSTGNPRWNNITALIDAMGIQVQLKYK